MDKVTSDYLRTFLPEETEWERKLTSLAQEENIPIMEPISMHFVMQLIRIKKPETILEIGSAIGYSALMMHNAHPEARIVTLERDETRYRQAVEHVQQWQQTEAIDVLFGDATTVLHQMSQRTFDVVLIDAAKGEYKTYFEYIEPMVTSGGIIISDNVLFKGFVADSKKDSPRYESIGQKLRDYNEWLMSHENVTTTIVPVGDGISISVKK